jgi:hypothetical protein
MGQAEIQPHRWKSPDDVRRGVVGVDPDGR